MYRLWSKCVPMNLKRTPMTFRIKLTHNFGPLSRGVSWGALEARAPRGHQRGAKKKEKKERERKREGRKEEKRGKEGNKKEKREERGSKKEKRKKERELNQYDERGAMQFQVQAGAPGKKTSGAPNWRRKGRKGRHAVSSASRGSREENVRGAKLTEKRTSGTPCSFKCKLGLQGRKRQGAKLTEKRTRRVPCSFKWKQGLQGRKRQRRQIDGEKENKSLNCQTYFPFGLRVRNVVFLNSIIMMLVSFTFLLYSTTSRQCRPWSYTGKKFVTPVLTNEKKK